MLRFLVLGVVSLTLLIHAMSQTAIAVAFPQITSSFDVSIVLAGWVLTAFQMAIIVSIPLAGKASDALGRKRTFIFVVMVFTVGSFLSAIAPNIYWLILSRAIQGAGAGGFVTSAAGIIADTFPEKRQRYVGLITSIIAVGTVLGPNVGGWLTQYFGWRSIFWVATPWGIGALIVAAVLLKPDGTVKKVDFDIKGAAFFAFAMVALMVGLTTLGGGATKTSWPLAVMSLALGFAFMLVFWRHERGARSPMIDLELLRGKSFAAANVFNLIVGVSLAAFVTLLPLYAVSVYGASTLESGLIVTPRAVAVTGASIITSFMLVRWGYRRPLLAGTAVMILASFLLALELNAIALPGVTLSGIGVMLTVVALSGLGIGLIQPAANNACIELLPERISTITGVRQICRNVGFALGIALGTMV
ncbi:MAG: MFS transporter, partial [Dehalococcoidia bacterium]|nr:MFS transporter [Dehalococcoidia bacterium]